MLTIILTAATASLAPPPEPLRTQLQSAIWVDLELNALIGNGNWSASLWYNAESGGSPDLHIIGLRCLQARSEQRCSFELVRNGGPVAALGEVAPDKLACVARFARTNEAWSVIHMPPRKAGHSRTSMRCEALNH